MRGDAYTGSRGGIAIVLFSDLVDSTALLARLGDDRMERVRRAHVEDVGGAVAGAGGRVIKTLGDGMMAGFASALGALRAAAGIQRSVERLNRVHGEIGLAARVGVAAGEPIADGEDLHGMAVVLASRLCGAAGSGEVLVHELVAALVASRDGVTLEDAGSYELKGVPARVRASTLRWRELAAEREDVAASSDAVTPVVQSAAEGGVEAPPSNGAAPAGRVPLPRLLAAYAGEPLIGRDSEIGQLRQATAAHTGRRAVLLLGEPGIGKTRHAAAVAADAYAQGGVVVLARCPPEASIAFEPWVRAIAELARSGDEAWRRELAQAAGAELSALVPELSEHSQAQAGVGASELVAAEGARFRLLRGIGAALAHAAGQAPLQIVLDDAHWCDAASAQALGQLLESPPVQCLTFVVTARERELGRGHPVSRALSELRRTRDLLELRLTGLDASGLAALVAARLGRAITPRLASRLQTRTAGNPFFAAELARDLDERGALRDGEELDTAPVPDAVTDLVEERLARLDPLTERLLVAIAAIGPSAPVALAARAAGIDEQDATGAVEQALSERLVDKVPAVEPTIAFPHALVREALLAGVDEATRSELHLAIAQALELDAETEPAELARHYGLAVAIAGPQRVIAAHEAAALAAAESHDHEQAAAQLRSALTLLAESDLATRGRLLLELGEQELLAADLVRARDAFRAAGDAARSTGDAGTRARAALGFAGGDIAFGWETGWDDVAAVQLLREGIDALGEDEPRLALQMIMRLLYALVYSDDEDALSALVARAERLDRRIGDTESHVLARFASLIAIAARSTHPLTVLDRFIEEPLRLSEVAERCGREDLLFRVMQWSAVAHYALGDVAACERAIERMAEIAGRLGSPRFAWEVDLNRGLRLLDRGDREGGEALVRRAGAVLRRLRPDLHVAVTLQVLLVTRRIYDDEQAALTSAAWVALETVGPSGVLSAAATFAAAADGEHDAARRGLTRLLTEDLSLLRRPDIQLPAALCLLADAAILSGDAAAGERLRPLLEPLRPYLIQATPAVFFGQIVEQVIGRLELLAGRAQQAVDELSVARTRADALGLPIQMASARVELATALNRRDRPGDREQARSALAEAEAIVKRHEMRGIADQAATARAELEGREASAAVWRADGAERTRPIRALRSRGGRRALSALVRGQDDEAIERRFLERRRQRALLRAMARGFQPAHGGGFAGVIAYELEPFAIEAPPEAPWRWAIEVDAPAGRARLIEPAPLEAAVTIHFGLADWVRVIAGERNPIVAMASGRCSVEGDVLLAARLEAMFGGGGEAVRG